MKTSKPSVDVSSFFEEVDATSAKERRLARAASAPPVVDAIKKIEVDPVEEARKRRLERQLEKESEAVKPLKKQSARTWQGESIEVGTDEKQCAPNASRRPPTDEEKNALSFWNRSWEVSLQGDKYFLFADGKKVMEMVARTEHDSNKNNRTT